MFSKYECTAINKLTNLYVGRFANNANIILSILNNNL